MGFTAAQDSAGILSFDEICRVVRLCAECGIRRVRLTGGEPLMREDIADLVRRLAAIPGIEDLALTTNGVLLARMAAGLKEAGLKRVNISLDAADAECYRQMTGFDLLLAGGRRHAQGLGSRPDARADQLRRDEGREPLAGPGPGGDELRLPVSVRFIEYCPTTQVHRAGELLRAQSRGPRA